METRNFQAEDSILCVLSYAISLEDVGIGCTMLHDHLTEIDLDEKNSPEALLGSASACGKEFVEIVSILVFQSFSV